MQVLRRTHGVVRLAQEGRLQPAAATPPARTEVTFGFEGNAGPQLGFGWSGSEAGYQWAVGERSLITLEIPGEADEYWLEMDVTPSSGCRCCRVRRLDVRIDGTLIHGFLRCPAARSAASSRPVSRRRQTVEIVLDHPNAASPMLVAGDGDDRRLAVSFRRLALICA